MAQSEKEIERAWEDIKYIYEKLSELGKKMMMTIDIIGSFATGLWTSESDIDIVYVNSG